MKETIKFTIEVDIKEPSLKEIMEAFKKAILECFQTFVNKVLMRYAKEYKKMVS